MLIEFKAKRFDLTIEYQNQHILSLIYRRISMKLYWSMPPSLRQHYQQELQHYQNAFATGNLSEAWHRLERAHILGQAWPLEHSYVHWLMLKFGIHIKSTKEVLGQIPRLLVGGVKSFVGHIPVGNTGGANVPPLRPMDISQDLKQILESSPS